MEKQPTNKEIVVAILRRLGRGSAFDVIREMRTEFPTADDEEIHRLCQGVHGSCSTLHEEGRLRRVGTEANPTTGVDVYVYEVEQVQRQPGPRSVTKAYKEKYEEALATIEERDEQIESMILVGQNRLKLLSDVLRGEPGARERAERILLQAGVA